MKLPIIAITLLTAACGHQQQLTAEQQWNYMPEWCHKSLIATGPVSVAPDGWKPATDKKTVRYRDEQTSASKEFIQRSCGVRPGSKETQS